MLGGSRNSRAVRLTIAGVLALLALYLMYTWRSEALEKGRNLSDAEMEYQTLQTRFDKLNRELRDAVQRQSQLDHDIKDHHLSYIQLQKEKSSIQTECTKEANALKREKKVLENHKAELTEQKDLAEREIDQTNAKLQQLTADYNELRQSAEQKYAALEVSCDQAADACNGKVSAKERELESAQTDLADISHRLDDCNGQLPVLRESVESCHRQLDSQESKGRNHAEEIKLLQGQLEKQQGQNQQMLRELKNTQRGGPPQLPDDFRLKRQVLQKDQFVPNSIHSPIPKSDSNVRDGVLGRPPLRSDGNWRDTLSDNNRDNPGEQAAPNSEDIKIPEDEKRRIFFTIQDRVNKGEELDDRQKQIYRLLYKYYGKTSSKDSFGDHQVRKPEVNHVPDVRAPQGNGQFDQGQVPPAQHVFVRELGGNVEAAKKPSQEAEQEEVKDLVEGHQKPGEFDNLGKADSPDDKEQEGGGVQINRADQDDPDNLDGADDGLNEDTDEEDGMEDGQLNQNEDGADDEDYRVQVDRLGLEGDRGKKEADNPIPNPIQVPDQAFNRDQKDSKNRDEYYHEFEQEDYGHQMFEKDRKIGLEERRRQHSENVEEEMQRAIGKRDSQRKQLDEQPLHKMDNEKLPHRLNEVR